MPAAKPKRKPGRNITLAERNTVVLQVRMTPEEAAWWRETARAWDCTVAELMASARLALLRSAREVANSHSTR